MDSPTLSQMLLKPGQNQSLFMYPTKEKQSNEHVAEMCSPLSKLKNNVLQTTPASAPPNRLVCKSATRSLGIRRRLRSVENSSSPFLGVKKYPKRVLHDGSTPLVKHIKTDEDCKFKTTDTEYNSAEHNTQPTRTTPVTRGVKRILYRKQVSSSLSKEKSNAAPLQSQIILQSTDISTFGFKTAGNKPIPISAIALNRAEKLLSSVDEKIKVGDQLFPEGTNKISTCSDKILSRINAQHESVDMNNIVASTLLLKNLNNSEFVLSQNEPVTYLVREENNNEPLVENICNKEIESLSVKENVDNKCQMSECTSPVLRSSRKRRPKRRKLRDKVNSDYILKPNTHETHTLPVDNADCSLLNDELDLEILAVDLNAKFEEEFECEQEPKTNLLALNRQSQPDISDETTVLNISTSRDIDRKHQSQCYDSKKVDSQSVLLTNQTFERPNSCNPIAVLPDTTSSTKLTISNDSLMKLNDVPNTFPLAQRGSVIGVATSNSFPKQQRSSIVFNQNKSEANTISGIASFLTKSSVEKDLSILKKCAHFEPEDMNSDDELLVQAGAQYENENLGFTTASKKAIVISKSAMVKAKNLFDKFDSENDNESKMEKSPNQQSNNISATNEFVGFMTASKKPVMISDVALMRANKLILDVDNNISQIQDDVQTDPTEVEHVDKLTNLFKSSSRYCTKKNKEFKLPKIMKNTDTLSKSEHFDKKLLGLKGYNQSQIAVSDESLVKAAELLEDLFC